MTVDLTGDDADQRPAVGEGHQRQAGALEVLVLRCQELVAGGQVDPQLDAVEQAAGLDELGRCR